MDDPGPANVIFKLALLLLLILVNAFFAMSEIAIISLNDNKVRKQAEEGDKRAIKILKLTANPSSFLSTIQFGVTLAGFLTSASAAANFSEPLTKAIAAWFSVSQNSSLYGLISAVAMVLVTLIIAFFSLVLGELAPKRIAMQSSEKISYKVVGSLMFIKSVMRPFIKILSVSTNIVVRLFGFDPNASQEVVTEEEIRMMVDAGEEKGVIEESQKEMINNIFDFDDVPVADVMTHRTDIEAVEISDKIEDVVSIGISKGYSRIPVYEDELDNIRGIIYVKDLLPFVGKSIPAGKKIAKLMREAHFIPESKRCGELFSEMTEKHVQMMMVSDEYGGVAGLVTIEDLLESIVGNIQDEYDQEDDEAIQLDEKTFTIDGTTDIEEVEDLLDIKLPEGEYETIGGLIMSELGRIPKPGEEAIIESAGFRFIVVELDERRIERVRAERIGDEPTV